MDLDVKSALEANQQIALDAIKGMKEDWKKHYDELKAMGAPVADITDKVDRALKRLDTLEQEMSRPLGGDGAYYGKSFGQLFTENDMVKEFAGRPYHKGGVAIDVKTGFFPESFSRKTTISSSTVGSSTPGILVPERLQGIVKPGVRKLRVRDLMPRLTTNNNAVEYVKENAFTNATSPTAETISKPESALTFTIGSANVRTLASWIPASRQILEDFAELQAYIDTRLIEGLKDVEDYELVAGDGTGQHLSGLSTLAGAYDTARNVSSDTKLDTLNHAISQIEDALQEADGIILHPRDLRAMQLLKTEEGGANKGMYLLGGPGGDLVQTIWGVPVATTTAVTRGTFYVGSFARYTSVHDRMAARIDISTEHADFFIRNMVAIRAEERLAFTCRRNDAVLYGSFPS